MSNVIKELGVEDFDLSSPEALAKHILKRDPKVSCVLAARNEHVHKYVCFLDCCLAKILDEVLDRRKRWEYSTGNVHSKSSTLAPVADIPVSASARPDRKCLLDHAWVAARIRICH